jgi:geranylgeranyl pyrophosphate synthase
MECSHTLKSHFFINMQHERQAELLREELEVLLAPLSEVVDLYDLVKESLSEPRRDLSVGVAHDHPWPLLPLQYEQALPAAAAFELFKAAAEVFDDAEDADSSDSLSTRYGPAVAINTATTLLILAEKAITRLKGKGVADSIIVQVMDVVNSYYTTACAGQHLDLSLNSKLSISEDTYLTIAAMKSASQTECGCRVGAILANAKQELIEIFAGFGHNLGLASQIVNDIQGIINESDLANRSITLPLIYALNLADNKARNQLKLAFNDPSEPVLDTTQIRDLLFRNGAVHQAMIKMEFFKQRALEALSKAEDEGVNVKRLKLFLE